MNKDAEFALMDALRCAVDQAVSDGLVKEDIIALLQEAIEEVQDDPEISTEQKQ